ncbi:NUDIX hydrolase [Pseudonocardia sp. TRM90224]|uniref:NUDIX hydrolase n=1 Tax=Pseudonocardia sp. TRM90224 TaxID=2812678 RepID=UPI001E31FECE|nr:NUDIX hydrolase [Pseudonocardia sp. TRM90224]
MEPTEPTRETRIGAYVVCVRDDALLLTRFAGSDRWTLPGGGLDHGERPEDAAVREVAEETGYRIELGGLVGIDTTMWKRALDGSAIDVHVLRILYTGEVVGGDLRHETGGSTDMAEWVPLGAVGERDLASVVRIGLSAAEVG